MPRISRNRLLHAASVHELPSSKQILLALADCLDLHSFDLPRLLFSVTLPVYDITHSWRVNRIMQAIFFPFSPSSLPRFCENCFRHSDSSFYSVSYLDMHFLDDTVQEYFYCEGCVLSAVAEIRVLNLFSSPPPTFQIL